MNALATLAAQTLKAQANAKKTAKPAAKKSTPVKKASNQPKTAKPSARLFKYRIVTGRPERGHALKAFTQAWFEIAGLFNGKGLDKHEADDVAGSTAINYHIREGRLIQKGGKVYLTAGGKLHFKARADAINEEQKKAWQTILRTGKHDGRLLKSASCIAPY